ncbi:MAG: glucose-1-phosphate adenylyltransferase [Fimbriiglobus sp.]
MSITKERKVLSIILGGGRGTRLFPLTKLRAKPAVPVAGKYRLIDIPISNCLNSGLHRIYVLTQFLSVSLHRHIANTYKFDMFSSGFVEVLAAMQTYEASDWYQGTADAVRQNLLYIKNEGCEEVLILSGDQLYRMDYRALIKTHRDARAEVTIAAIPVKEDQTSSFGLLRMDDSGRVSSFVEKPRNEEERKPYYTPGEWIDSRGIRADGRHYLANMGIYLFNTDVLIDLLTEPPLATDFGKEVFPRNVGKKKIHAHLFDGYWEDLGTIKSYHEASLALSNPNPPFDFYQPEGLIYTRMRNLPASRMDGAMLKNSVVSDGCRIGVNTTLERCLIGVRSRIGNGCSLRDTVLIGSDRYETEGEQIRNNLDGVPNLNVGDNTIISNAILDKDCRVGSNVRILNEKGLTEADDEHGRWHIRDGIVCIPRGSVIPDGTVI